MHIHPEAKMIIRFLFIYLGMIGVPSIIYADGTKAIKAITGKHTRIVWVQDQNADGADTGANGDNLILMGLDSLDGKGERAILAGKSNYHKPLLTPDGQSVVYSNVKTNKVHVVNFDGSGAREISDGQAADVWRDPQSDMTWIYIAYSIGNDKWGNVHRVQLDDPGKKEFVWNATPMTIDNFQISADGRYASGEYPWPKMGVADLNKGTWTQLGKGCWASMAPDNSYLSWVFDGPHRNVSLSTLDGRNKWKVNINSAENNKGYEVYHPRWSNHVRYLSVTGPYMVGNRTNKIRGGGRDVEIYLGKYNNEMTGVEYWARVTENDKGDFFPDAWIEDGENASVEDLVKNIEKKGTSPSVKWPDTNRGVVFLWEDGSKQNRVYDSIQGFLPNNIEAHGHAKYGRHYEMDVTNGYFTCEDVDSRLLKACRSSNQMTLEMVVKTDQGNQDGPARILSFSSGSSSRNFTLGQDGSNLIMRLRTTVTGENGSNPQVTICPLELGQSQHVMVTYTPGMMICYLNGRVAKTIVDVTGDFSNWESQHLIIGDEYGGKRNWNGSIEGVAIYDRTIGSDEAQKHYDLYMEKINSRNPVEKYTVEIQCVETSQIPDPKAIEPYLRALVVNKYAVKNVVEGALDAKEILIAHWAIMDKKIIPTATVPIGEARKMTLEKFDDHPELESERMVTDIMDYDLPLFYEIN